MSGALTLPGGTWDAFGDQALLSTTGGTPFGAQLTESGANPTESMSVELAVRLPGDVEETTGEARDGALVWSAPLDGSAQDLATRPCCVPTPAAAAGRTRWAQPPWCCSSSGWPSASPWPSCVATPRSLTPPKPLS